jgi:hypothetical protein
MGMLCLPPLQVSASLGIGRQSNVCGLGTPFWRYDYSCERRAVTSLPLPPRPREVVGRRKSLSDNPQVVIVLRMRAIGHGFHSEASQWV